ncbi:phosphoribosylanthranilate isomerase [Neobacillus sp. FSL H8-0543]|uniref:phosphoribosylanthranilate isomerase n=1 Tax=Neobacillus sp. FSL H8-0543 TaxID=2954672 RepID=UPI0031588F54
MKVKICGISDIETARAAVEYGADAIGFIFAQSKRKITKEKAKEIVAQLPKDVLKVGVFVNEVKEVIEDIANQVGLTHIQLHGDEKDDFCQSLSLPVIKGFSIRNIASLQAIDKFTCEYILLDGPKGKYSGGNGLAFDWSIIPPTAFGGKRVILAGGLNEENILPAILEVNPDMVDVSSGVETDGVKDLNKIKTFITMAKGAN